MAYPSPPELSPPAISNGNRGFSPSPPPITSSLSKREKSHSKMSAKLAELENQFSMHRDPQYRMQLQAIQADLSLIAKTDLGLTGPLDDSPEHIAEMFVASFGPTGLAGPMPTFTGQRGSVEPVVQSGKYYQEFVEKINDFTEEKDAKLTQLYDKYSILTQELNDTREHLTYLAQEEHRQLASTIRERLKNRLLASRKKLLQDKEQLDVADSNALLLFPNQFSISNPISSSVSGLAGTGNRKLRHTRGRAGEVEDSGRMFPSGDNGLKRKRGLEDNDIGSPGKHAKTTAESKLQKQFEKQFTSPLYSVDKLFTEKELAMHLNYAATATAHYFNGLRQRETNGAAPEDEDQPELDDPVDSGGPGTVADDLEDDATETPQTVDMERETTNRSRHAMRSRGNPDPPNASYHEYTGGLPHFGGPFIIPTTMVSRTGQAPPPPALAQEEADADLALMMSKPGAVSAIRTASARDNLRSEHIYTPAGGRLGVDPGAGPRGFGGVPMSAQSSMTAFGDGATPMSRAEGGSAVGVGMKRSASGAGFGGDGGKRMRNR